MEQPKEYYAFISYKREDEKWAKWLQDKLEHYKFPTNMNGRTDLPKNIRPTFRDVTDLKPGVLAEEIDNALRNSEWLIVVCSPRSAKSPWVCKEAQTFIDLGRADHIIPFVIEGNPFSNYTASECYPEALLNLTGSKELLAANINEMGRDAAVVKVVARMFDLRFDTLWQRYNREVRKRRFWIWTGILVLAITAIGVAGWLWSLNTQLTNKNRQLSIENVKVGSREVVGLLEQGNYVDALHELQTLAVLWQEDFRKDAPEFEQALRAMYRYEHTDGISGLFSMPLSDNQRYIGSDSSYIYICTRKDWQDEIQRFDINTGEYKDKVFPFQTLRDSAMVMEMKGQKVLYCTSHKYNQNASLRLFDLKSGKDILLMKHSTMAWMLSDDCILLPHVNQYLNQPRVAALIKVRGDHVMSCDSILLPFAPMETALIGDTLIIASGSSIATWHIKQRQWINQINYRLEGENDYAQQNVLAINPICHWIATLRPNNELVLLGTNRCDSVVLSSKMVEASVAFNPSGTMMAVADTYSDSLIVYATESMIPLFRFSSIYIDGAGLEFINENTMVVYSSLGYNAISHLSIFSVEAQFNSYLLFSPNGSYRLEAFNQGDTLGIVNDSTNECILDITHDDNRFEVFGFSPSGHYLQIENSEYQYALLDFHIPQVIPVLPSFDYNTSKRLKKNVFLMMIVP